MIAFVLLALIGIPAGFVFLSLVIGFYVLIPIFLYMAGLGVVFAMIDVDFIDVDDPYALFFTIALWPIFLPMILIFKLTKKLLSKKVD